MKKNVWALGNRTIGGDVNRVYAAGNLNINEANIKKLRVAGEIEINDSYIDKLNVAGNIKAVNSNFGDVKAVGNVEINGHSKALTVTVTGTLKAEFLECNVLRNSINGPVTEGSNILSYKGFFKAFSDYRRYFALFHPTYRYTTLYSKQLSTFRQIFCDLK